MLSRQLNAGDEPYWGCKSGTVRTGVAFKGMGMDENLGRSLELLEHFSIPVPPRCQKSKPILFFQRRKKISQMILAIWCPAKNKKKKV